MLNFKLKFQTVAEKTTAKIFRGLLFAAPCMSYVQCISESFQFSMRVFVRPFKQNAFENFVARHC